MDRMLFAALSCGLLVGCAEGAHGHGGGHGGGGGGSNFPTEALAIGAIAAAEAAAVATMPPPAPDPDPDPDPYIGAYPPPPPGPSGNRTDFEPAAALAAIDHLDFGSCRSTGTLIGWNHARLTFEPDGAVSRVEIDSAVGMPPVAIECLRGVLLTLSAPAFEGPPVTIGAAFYVQ